MKTIICEKPGLFTQKDTTTPQPRQGEVLLRIKRIGVCGTDLHAFAGNQAYFTYPRILGHELAAVIEDPNGSSTWKKGDKVVVIPYIHCGKCVACLQGKTNCCTRLQVLGVHTDGGMQEYFALSEELLLPAENLSFEEMAIVEPLAVAAHAVKRAKVEKGEQVLVMGCGPIGIGIMVFAKLAGAEVTALDINESRLKFVRKQIGIKNTVLPSESLHQDIEKITKGKLFNAVFDATGHKLALESGPEYMSHGGRFLLVGLSKGDLVFNHPAIHAKESSILCSRNATAGDFQEVIAVLKSGDFPTDAFITHHLSFDKVVNEFASLTQPENMVIKGMVQLS
ncbi:zinc-binding alcohol dehydrogenase family protein [Pleomorphovibrio marinus]|uniref:zinc-binding alcohol dehydrogenase family protein n=1 Tax=Pleomorphovibrio marinus TaxID=2164132 RepID=UPI000E0BAA90|nr:zinc-binding alcohol dehydrogenase family protein [Pleomorphovibrio marinus]